MVPNPFPSVGRQELTSHQIRRSQPADRPLLVALWERSVRPSATLG